MSVSRSALGNEHVLLEWGGGLLWSAKGIHIQVESLLTKELPPHE